MTDLKKINPNRDGLDHINIYSKGKTLVGKKLSNFAYSPFTHCKYGHFNSIEGLWYYLLTNNKYEKLRNLHGYNAKKEGRIIINSLKWNDLRNSDDLDFREDIKEGIRQKLRENKDILNLLCKTGNKPLLHYYYYESKNKIGEDGNPLYTVRNGGHFWIIEELERIREVSIVFLENKKNTNND